MLRPVSCVVIAILTAAAACGDGANGGDAEYRFDQEQTVLHPALSPLALYPADTAPGVHDLYKQNLAQTFTPSSDQVLHWVYLPIACARDVLVTLQIREGGPDGPVLADGNHDPARETADGTMLNFQFGDGVPLTGGTTYAIFIASFPRPGAAERTCSIIPGPDGDHYPGGTLYHNNPGFPDSYWVDTGGDLAFRTRVR